MKLWLVRHAQPLIAPGVCYGATDVAAEPQATLAAAQILSKTLPQSICVVSSPLERCQSLARCLQGLRPDLIYAVDNRLAEMDFGHWEGRRWDSIPQAEFDCWTADFSEYRFGGKASVNEFMQRVASLWDENQGKGSDVTWITHAGVIRAATLISRGERRVEQSAQWPRDAPAFGSWCLFEACA